MTRRKLNLAVAVAGMAVAFALPAVGQESQGIGSQAAATTMDLSTLQRTGPGGDLAKSFQATTQGKTNSTSTCPQETCYECMVLDSYNPNNTYDPNVPGSAIINTVQSANALTAGQPYLITIKGTVSYWGLSYYTAPIGNPEPHPVYPSPAVASALQGDVASDWEYLFAYPNNNHGNLFTSGPVHIIYQGISLDNGASFVDLVPLGGQIYSPGHTYSYLVVGKGQQAKFNISDFGPHSDNYGMYKICIYKLKPVTSCGGSWGGD